MDRILIIFLLGISSSPIFAGGLNFEFLNKKSCRFERVSSELPSEMYNDNHPIREKSKGDGILRYKESSYGFCEHNYYSKPKSLSCRIDSDNSFPLKGAKYVEIMENIPNAAYYCVSGCENAPKYIHDQSYEASDEPDQENYESYKWLSIERKELVSCRNKTK